ncbi:MAG TPA: Holliday junction branch migration protein RuvA [Gammaproteobacteria bacterium]|nr:Holliday junction branch migration protein RuvA [Gammaproteobacteria bacterium]
MISRLTGMILEKQPPCVLIDVQGIGYEVFVPMSTFYQLPEVRQKVTLFTHFVVREDAQLLYGFHDALHRSVFQQVIKTNGVGPKMALAILSGMNAQEFIRYTQQQDLAQLTKIPGIGKRTAERLLIEMRDKFKDYESVMMQVMVQNSDPQQEAISALVSLGYRAADATRCVTQLAQPSHTSSDLIRLALQQL